MRMFRAVLAVLLAATLSACTVVRIGEPYDPNIESGLSAYYKSAVEFVKQAELNATKSSGHYGSAESNAFYAGSAAALADLKLRANIVGGDRTCPSVKIAGAVMSAAGAELDKAGQVIGAGAGEEPVVTMSDNCTTVVIHNVELAQNDLEADHKERGIITPAIADINLQAIEASVRVALRTVQSHK